MFGIGVTEIILILIVALVIVGPEKLPELARTVAKGFNEFKRTTNDLKRSIDWNGEDKSPKEDKTKEVSPVEEVKETGDDRVDNEPIKKKIAPKKSVRKKPAPKKTKKTTSIKTAAKKATPKKPTPERAKAKRDTAGKESHG